MMVQVVHRGYGQAGNLVLVLQKYEPERVHPATVDPDAMRVASNLAEAMRQHLPGFSVQQQPQPGMFTGQLELMLSMEEYRDLGRPVPGDKVVVRLFPEKFVD